MADVGNGTIQIVFEGFEIEYSMTPERDPETG